jgi:hypothetical protein
MLRRALDLTARIRALDRKIGQQQVALDFVRQAFAAGRGNTMADRRAWRVGIRPRLAAGLPPPARRLRLRARGIDGVAQRKRRAFPVRPDAE